MIKRLLFISLFVIPILCYTQNTEMIPNGNFDDDSEWRLIDPGWSIGSGVASFNGTGASYLRMHTDSMISTIGDSLRYILKFKLTMANPGEQAYFRVYGSTHSPLYYDFDFYNPGWITLIFTTLNGGNPGGIEFYATSYGDAFDMDSISLMQLPALGSSPFFVATDGADTNAGTLAAPWATWQRAVNAARPGDTINFRSGVYYKGLNESWEVPYTESGLYDGTRENYIVYRTYPPDITDNWNDSTMFIARGDTTYRRGHYAIFDCRYQYIPQPDTAGIEAEPPTATNRAVVGIASGAEFIKYQNLIVRNLYQKRRYVQATGWNFSWSRNIIVEGCALYNIGGHGFYYSPWWPSDGEDSTIFINNDGWNCVDSFSVNVANYRDLPGSPQSGTWANAFMITTTDRPNSDTNSYVQFKYNRAWHNADEGVNHTPIGTVVTQGNWSFANGLELVHGVYDCNSTGHGWKINGGQHTSQSDSNAIQNYFYNNIAAFNWGYGHGENNNGIPPKNRNVYNNTLYSNQWGFQALPHGPTDSLGLNKNRYKNNISYDNRLGNVNVGGEANMYENVTNSWTTPPGATVTDADFVLLDSAQAVAQMKAPRDSLGNLPTITFATLTSGSDLIDVGTDVGISYNGSAPDLGYVEFGDNDEASFSADVTDVCKEDSVQFTDESTNSPTAWAWTFTGGSPSTSTAQNPKIEYPTPGTYNVQLIATGSPTDTFLRTSYIVVRDSVVADFSASATSVSLGANVTFTDLTTNNPTSWSWTFAGGTPSTSTSQNPVVQYNTAGVHQVVLQATNSCNTDTETKVGYITVTNPYIPPSGSYKLTIEF